MTCLLVFLQGYVRRLWYEYDGPPKSSKNFRRLKFFFLGKEIPPFFAYTPLLGASLAQNIYTPPLLY